MNKPTWEVVSMVDEPLPLVAAFVAHFLKLGASRISLLLDRPRPEIVAALSSVPQVHVTIGDSVYWASQMQRRPGQFGARQRHFANMVYATAQFDWLFHADCDEFLHLDQPVADMLAAVPADKVVLRFPTLERVSIAESDPASGGIFDGVFKRKRDLTEPQRTSIWGDLARLFRADGFLGHGLGKSMVRAGQPLSMAAHFPYPTDMAGGIEDRRAWLSQNEVLAAPALLHFDGLTPLHWVLKLLGKLDAGNGRLRAPPAEGKTVRESRMSQIRMVHDALGNAAALTTLARAALTLDQHQRELFGGDAGLATIQMSLEQDARALFPHLALDFSTEGFDADLRRHRAELVKVAGLLA